MVLFNSRLRQLRLERHLSQQELSNYLISISDTKKGYSKSSINMYERGDREPGLDVIETIADFFNVDVGYLLGSTDVRNSYTYSMHKSLSLTSDEKLLLYSYRDLNDQGKQYILQTMDMASRMYKKNGSDISDMEAGAV